MATVVTSSLTVATLTVLCNITVTLTLIVLYKGASPNTQSMAWSLLAQVVIRQ